MKKIIIFLTLALPFLGISQKPPGAIYGTGSSGTRSSVKKGWDGTIKGMFAIAKPKSRVICELAVEATGSWSSDDAILIPSAAKKLHTCLFGSNKQIKVKVSRAEKEGNQIFLLCQFTSSGVDYTAILSSNTTTKEGLSRFDKVILMKCQGMCAEGVPCKNSYPADDRFCNCLATCSLGLATDFGLSDFLVDDGIKNIDWDKVVSIELEDRPK